MIASRGGNMHKPRRNPPPLAFQNTVYLIKYVVAHIGSGGVRNLNRQSHTAQTLIACPHRQGRKIRFASIRGDRLIHTHHTVIILNIGGVQVDSDPLKAHLIPSDCHAQAEHRVRANIGQHLP